MPQGTLAMLAAACLALAGTAHAQDAGAPAAQAAPAPGPMPAQPAPGLPPARLQQIQRALVREKLDGWLFADFRRSDAIAYRVLGLEESGAHTRDALASGLVS